MDAARTGRPVEPVALDLARVLRLSGGAADTAALRELKEIETREVALLPGTRRDRKSTRLNSSHQIISYAVFCLKKKKQHRRCKPAFLATTITTPTLVPATSLITSSCRMFCVLGLPPLLSTTPRA